MSSRDLTRLRLRCGAGTEGTDSTLNVAFDGRATGRDLVDALHQQGYTHAGVWIDGVWIDPDAPLQHQQIHDGAVLGHRPNPIAPGMYLAAVAGERVGSFWPIGDGPFVIGRSPQSDVVLSPDNISRCHARIDRDANSACIIRDYGSIHATMLNGHPVPGHAVLRPGDVVGIAANQFVVVELSAEERIPASLSVDGQQVVSRRFRSPSNPADTTVHAPAKPRLRSIPDTPLWQSLLAAIPMFAFFLISGRNPWLLPVLLISPFAYAGFGVVRRRRIEAQNTATETQYVEDRLGFDRRCAAVIQAMSGQQRDAALPALVPALHSSGRHTRLWETTPDDPRFLSCVVGLADLPIELNIVGDHSSPPSRMHSVPVRVDLQTDNLGLVGPTHHGHRVALHVVLSMATTHAPLDMRIWVVAPGDADHWDRVAGWLPHCSGSLRDRGGRVATTSNRRAAVLRQLLTAMDDRATGGSYHGRDVVFVDRPEAMEDIDVSRLIEDGQSVGITVVVCSPIVPHGTTANLRFGGSGQPAVLESRTSPRIGHIALQSLSVDVASDAAASLAGLRMNSTADRQPNRKTRLTDLVGLPNPTADALGDRWATPSPGLIATIGDSAGATKTVDLVADGPHAMIGGATGSGKTEFLKTLFASLLIENHPDDLSIVFVDFKGGVDFDNLRGLPHVLDLATNQDPAGFARTVALLTAEVQRRQRKLVEAEVTDIRSYQEQQRSRPEEIAPMPRLLLVVDEFAELLDSEVGKANLAELVSVARVGRALGIHLLLLTQVVDHKLPTHIDANTTLRICMRASTATSKTVLGSDLAAHIPKDQPGQGFVVAGDGPAVSFQTARVAGPRNDQSIADRRPPVIAALAALPTQTLQFDEGATRDPAFADTDLAAVCAAIAEATIATGWRGPAVPWPAGLPERLVDHGPCGRGTSIDPRPICVEAGSLSLGLADLPDQQAQHAVAFHRADDCVLFLGENPTELTDQLLATAVRLAEDHSPAELHLAGIALDNEGLDELALLPHCMGVASNNSSKALRLIRMIAQQVGDRRLAMARGSSGASKGPRVVLLVAGFDRLMVRGGEPDPCLAPLRALIASVAGTGVQVLISGTATIAERLGTTVRKRYLFDTSGRGGPDLSVDARCIDLQTQAPVQMLRLAPASAQEVAVRSARIRKLADEPSAPGPQRVVDVPWPMPLELAPDRPGVAGHELLVGVDTESGEWIRWRARSTAAVLPVVGRRQSGRTEALRSIAHLNRGRFTTLVLDHLGDSELIDCGDSVATDGTACIDLMASIDGPILLLVDNAHAIDNPAPILAAADRPNTMCVITGAQPLLNGIGRTVRFDTAIVLAPERRRDASPILTALPDEVIEGRAGRGVFVGADGAMGVQMASTPVIVPVGVATANSGSAVCF